MGRASVTLRGRRADTRCTYDCGRAYNTIRSPAVVWLLTCHRQQRAIRVGARVQEEGTRRVCRHRICTGYDVLMAMRA